MPATRTETMTNPRDSLPNTYDEKILAREIDFVSNFTRNWDALRQVMGIMRPIRKAPGTTLAQVKASVTLERGDVQPGEVIPYSKTNYTKVDYEDIEIEKYAKAVTIEEVNKYGAAIAVEKSDEAFRIELQNAVLTRFYTRLNDETYATIGTTDNFQKALALSKANVIDVFNKARRTVSEIVGFCNVMDAYEYLGSADVTIQSQFGVQYVQDFLGFRTLFLMSEPDVARGKVIALPVENIDLYYIDPSDSEFARLGLDYTVQGETNLIGFHAQGAYHTAVGESYALMGLKLWAEYADGISIVKFGGTNPSVQLSQKTMSLAVSGTKDLTATTVPADASVTWTSSDDTVASVTAGSKNATVTGVGAGTAVVTAKITVEGTDYTATCSVSVHE